MRTKWIFAVAAVAAVVAWADPGARPRDDFPVRPAPPKFRSAGLTVPFVENVGQAPQGVRFTAHTFAGPVHVTADGAIEYLMPPGATESRSVVLRERLRGAVAPAVRGAERSTTCVNVFRGRDPAGWRRAIPAWTAVSLARGDAAPSLELRARGANVEKLFRVPPGSDASQIRVDVDGARSLAVADDGALAATTDAGVMTFTAPVAWQDDGGARRRVDVAYAVDGTSYGFRTGPVDPSLPLVIDPLIASTFVGGGNDDGVEDVDVHWASHDVYVTGRAGGGAFTTTGTPVDFHGGASDAFVARISADLTQLLAVTLLGGSDDETGLGVAVGLHGVFAVGETVSTDLPTTPGVYGPAHHGGFTDGWIANLDPLTLDLVACTYHGGSGRDRLTAVTAASGINVAGETSSEDLWFPERAMQKDLRGYQDLVFASVREDLTDISFQSLYGGHGGETVSRIISGEGDVVAVGNTDSSDFPTSPTAFQRVLAGQEDAFVLHLHEDYSGVFGCTLLGGAADGYEWEGADGVAWAAWDEVFVCGVTNCADFPVSGPATKSIGDESGNDAFVARLNWDMSALVASKRFGGSDADRAYDVVVLDDDSVAVVGATRSSDFPASTTIDQTYNGAQDGFVARLSPDLSTVESATFLGSVQLDFARAVAVSGDVLYVAGSTWGWDFPTTPGAFDRDWDSSGPASEGFLVAMTLESAPPAVDSFILPRVVKILRRKTVAKSTATVTGTFDTGSEAVDLTGPATLDVAGSQFQIPGLTRTRGRALRYRSPTVVLKVTPSKTGSSRASFSLKITGAAVEAIDAEAPLSVRFRTGSIDGGGVVKLTKGRYKLGKKRGALVAPALFPYACKANLRGPSRDTLIFRLGLASNGVTPAQAPAFSFRLADGFQATIPAASFVRRGDSYVFKGKRGGLPSVTLDYARERIVVTAAAVEVGVFVPGAQPVPVAVKVGDSSERVVRVRMACNSRTLWY